MAAAEVVKSGGANDLLTRLASDPLFAGIDLESALDPERFIGRCPQQVERFVETVGKAVNNRWSAHMGTSATLQTSRGLKCIKHNRWDKI